MTTDGYSELFAKLNPVQKEAVLWNNGSLLVLAGPGSGKTAVLTCRIARLLSESHGESFCILGLTFTNKAADEMRQRVEIMVPENRHRIFLGTFHSFCADVIRQHGNHIGIKPDYSIYSKDDDLQAVLDSAVQDLQKRENTVSPMDSKMLPAIKRMKSMLVEPENCATYYSSNPIFGKRLVMVYSHYEKKLKEQNALDFNSLLSLTHELFTKFPALSKLYRKIYKFICIDEFQDTNDAQYKIIRALCGDSFKNLFIVADDDQIIYQWNGASHKRLEEFQREFNPELIQLPLNYRCPAEVVELANKLIRNNNSRYIAKKPLQSFKKNDVSIDTVRILSVFSDADAEAEGIAEDIKLNYNSSLSSVAVLGRTRKTLDRVQTFLKNKGIESKILQRKDDFESKYFILLHSILKLTCDKWDDKALIYVNGSFSAIFGRQADIEKIKTDSRQDNSGLLAWWIKEIKNIQDQEGLDSLIDLVEDYLIVKRNFFLFSGKILDFFEKFKVPSNQIDGKDDLFYEEKSVWNELIHSIKSSLGEKISLESFLQELEMRSKESPPSPNSVSLMTIHSAKGKEFLHVYLASMVEDELPSYQSRQKGDNSPEMEEERRNCFVAITRTIETLTISYYKCLKGYQKTPSRFLKEMGLIPQSTEAQFSDKTKLIHPVQFPWLSQTESLAGQLHIRDKKDGYDDMSISDKNDKKQ